VPGRAGGSEGRGRAARASPVPADEVIDIRGLLGLAARLTGIEAPLGTEQLAPPKADAALQAAEEIASALLARAAADGHRGTADLDLIGLVLQLGRARISLREHLLARHSTALAGVQEALQRLRAIRTAAEVIAAAPAEIARLGFGRTMVSRIHGSSWVVCGSYVRDDPAMARLIVDAGSTVPEPLTGRLLETDMLRKRKSILVTDVQANHRVHARLKVATMSRSYVAAPLICGTVPVGMLHADTLLDGRTADRYDRDLLGMFADGLGYSIERCVISDRLSTLRAGLGEFASSLSDLLFGIGGADLDSAGDPARQPRPVTTTPAAAGRGPAADRRVLTRRELEVLQHMAAGESNAAIARSLFLSEGTVKSHVKHVLRKLGATNRAQAVSRYLSPASDAPADASKEMISSLPRAAHRVSAAE
jgi:DNA-binding CsgD family transcriptional regulator